MPCRYFLMAKPPMPIALYLWSLPYTDRCRWHGLLHWTILSLDWTQDWQSDVLVKSIDLSRLGRFWLAFDQLIFGAHVVLGASRPPEGASRFRAEAMRALAAAGVKYGAPRDNPHITLSYDNSVRIPTLTIDTICWKVDEIFLVESLIGRAQHRHLMRWQLC